MLNNKVILITGGTGSFGNIFTDYIFKNFKPKKVIIFSRDEFKQYEMAKKFPENEYPIRFFLGDIRDKERLLRAFTGVDYVIHAAALKQVPALEYNPFEAVRTNILGAQNIIEAALDTGVKKVVALSTDKAVSPVNLYGASKMTMEKIFSAANSYVGDRDIKFCAVRYGNVVGSRGSVIPFFLKLKKEGKTEFPITDERMTRFWITLEQSVNLVNTALNNSVGGEIFVPKIPSMKIIDLVKAISKNGSYKVVGIRPGEKIHEILIQQDEGRNTFEMSDHYIILPQFEFENRNHQHYEKSKRVPEGFDYRSNTNEQWLTKEQLKNIITKLKINK